MAYFSKTTNPKSIALIPKSSVDLAATRNSLGQIESFSYKGIDFASNSALKSLSSNSEIFLEIYRDFEVHRFELGTKVTQKELINEPLKNYFEDPTRLKWYLFVTSGQDIRARIENLQPEFEEELGSQGLISVEPTDLGERIWRVEKDPSRPILQVNNSPELDLIDKLRDPNPLYKGFIIINAVEQYLELYADNPEAQNDGDWQELWKEFFLINGIEDIESGDLTPEQKQDWVSETISQLAELLKFRTKIISFSENK